jgi:hypothetical protein
VKEVSKDICTSVKCDELLPPVSHGVAFKHKNFIPQFIVLHLYNLQASKKTPLNMLPIHSKWDLNIIPSPVFDRQ